MKFTATTYISLSLFPIQEPCSPDSFAPILPTYPTSSSSHHHHHHHLSISLSHSLCHSLSFSFVLQPSLLSFHLAAAITERPMSPLQRKEVVAGCDVLQVPLQDQG